MKDKEVIGVDNKAIMGRRSESLSVKHFYTNVKAYLRVARLDHWFKNVFMFIGIILAIAHYKILVDFSLVLKGSFAILLACLTSSSNYIINEIYDAQFDRRHPNKKFRSVAAGIVSVNKLVLIDILLITIALTCSYLFFNIEFFLFMSLLFVIGGIFYNIPPVRTKDLPFLDIIGESINNPLRLLLGWFAITNSNGLPILGIVGYWSFGAILVTGKRLAEFRHFGDKLISYRPTFKFYNDNRLISIYFLFVLLTLISFILIGIGYDSRLLYLLPLLIIFFIWFSILTFQKNSIVKEPERIFEKKFFAFFCGLSIIFFIVVFMYV